MKIYKLKPDSNYRMMFPEDKAYNSDSWEFKCNPIAPSLRKFTAYWSDKKDKPKPDIALIGMCTFAFKKHVSVKLFKFLETSELIEFEIEQESWVCLNTLQRIDQALDDEKSIYMHNSDGIKLLIERYAFDMEIDYPNSLFKIPQDNFTNEYFVDLNNNDSFLDCVKSNNFTGLKFTPVYPRV